MYLPLGRGRPTEKERGALRWPHKGTDWKVIASRSRRGGKRRERDLPGNRHCSRVLGGARTDRRLRKGEGKRKDLERHPPRPVDAVEADLRYSHGSGRYTIGHTYQRRLLTRSLRDDAGRRMLPPPGGAREETH